MKTLEEIKKHLSKVEYDDYAKFMIHGFLVGRGDIQPMDHIEWVEDRRKDFDEFMEWFEEGYSCDSGFTLRSPINLDDLVSMFCDQNRNKSDKLKELEEGLAKLNETIIEGENIVKSGNPYSNLMIEPILKASYKLREDLKKMINEEMAK